MWKPYNRIDAFPSQRQRRPVATVDALLESLSKQEYPHAYGMSDLPSPTQPPVEHPSHLSDDPIGAYDELECLSGVDDFGCILSNPRTTELHVDKALSTLHSFNRTFNKTSPLSTSAPSQPYTHTLSSSEGLSMTSTLPFSATQRSYKRDSRVNQKQNRTPMKSLHVLERSSISSISPQRHIPEGLTPRCVSVGKPVEYIGDLHSINHSNLPRSITQTPKKCSAFHSKQDRQSRNQASSCESVPSRTKHLPPQRVQSLSIQKKSLSRPSSRQGFIVESMDPIVPIPTTMLFAPKELVDSRTEIVTTEDENTACTTTVIPLENAVSTNEEGEAPSSFFMTSPSPMPAAEKQEYFKARTDTIIQTTPQKQDLSQTMKTARRYAQTHRDDSREYSREFSYSQTLSKTKYI